MSNRLDWGELCALSFSKRRAKREGSQTKLLRNESRGLEEHDAMHGEIRSGSRICTY